MPAKYTNVTGAFLYELERLMKDGKERQSRNGKVREIEDACFTIENPLQRIITLLDRKDSIFHKVAESLWVIAGRNDIKWLEAYLPGAAKWADDGEHWRAGYGPRLRFWPGIETHGHDTIYTDQVSNCVDLLVRDPDTRQAVMSLWDPSQDFAPSLDVPCNNWIHWLIRDGKLNMKVSQRSSDIMWGFSGINAFEWSILHQMMACWTDTEVGKLTYFISSFHIYEQHWEKAKLILSKYPVPLPLSSSLSTLVYTLLPPAPKFDYPRYTTDYILDGVFITENAYREGDYTYFTDLETDQDGFWQVMLAVLRIFWMMKNGNVSDEAIVDEVLKYAMKTDIGYAVMLNLNEKERFHKLIQDKVNKLGKVS